jgi:hypothetical protein
MTVEQARGVETSDDALAEAFNAAQAPVFDESAKESFLIVRIVP